MVTTIHLELGATVMSADSKSLGTVKEIGGDRFKVERRFRPDYWLANEYVDHAIDGVVQMILIKEGIGAARVTGPR